MSFSENLAVFLAVSDFGTAATFNANTTVNGIFDRDYVEVLGSASRGPVFRCAEADVPAAVGKTLVVGGVSYTVRNAEADGTGMTRLQLEAA